MSEEDYGITTQGAGAGAAIVNEGAVNIGQKLLSALIAAERPQEQQIPTDGPVTVAMVEAASNRRWSSHPEYYNGSTLHQSPQQSYAAVDEGYRGVSVAERDFDL